jgi:ribosomal protein S6--L-glutamate ligase
MRVRLLIDRPGHPVLTASLDRLGERHDIGSLLTETLDERTVQREQSDPADVYLLKARSARALALAAAVEDVGARLINTSRATSLCLDRAAMAERLADAGVPHARTVHLPRLADLGRRGAGIGFPAVVKSRRSRRGDLVEKLETAAAARPLLEAWADEEVIVQRFEPGDGFDVKVWAIGSQIHAARRRTPLVTGATGAAKRNEPLDRASSPDELEDIGRAVGSAFGLELYGVDVIVTAAGPRVVDVNAFPGFRGVPDAAARLAAHVEQAGVEGIR